MTPEDKRGGWHSLMAVLALAWLFWIIWPTNREWACVVAAIWLLAVAYWTTR